MLQKKPEFPVLKKFVMHPAVEAIIKHPKVRDSESLIFHESCQLERAMAAALRSLGRSAAPYEVQWEVNDLFGTHFGNSSIVEIERTLRRAPVFVQTNDGTFSVQPDVDELDVDAEAVRAICIDILSRSEELLACDDLIDRIEAAGQFIGEVTADILAVILRSVDKVEEIGRNRFRYRV